MATVMVEIPADEETAAALADPRRREAIGEPVKLVVPMAWRSCAPPIRLHETAAICAALSRQ
jgi:hypothetical protein